MYKGIMYKIVLLWIGINIFLLRGVVAMTEEVTEITSLEFYNSKIREYTDAGFNLRQVDNSTVVLERRSPISVPLLLLALFTGIGFILYLFGAGRRLFQVKIYQDSIGQTVILGDTLEEFRNHKKRTDTTYWIVIGVIVLFFVYIISTI